MTYRICAAAIVFAALSAPAMGQSADLVSFPFQSNAARLAITVKGTGRVKVDTPALQRALDLCASTGRPLYLDATDKPLFIDSTVTLQPKKGTAVVGLRITAYNKPDGSPTIWFTGSGVCWKTYGLKSSLISGVRIQLRGKSGVGFWFATNSTYQSTSANVIQLCAVSGNEEGQKSGFWIGPEDDNTDLGQGSNDINTFTFDHCSVSGASGSAVRFLETGFWIWGGNSKDLQFTGCSVNFCSDAAFLVDANTDYHRSAYIQGMQFLGCDSSHVATAFRIKGGCEAVMIGGRTEELDDQFAVEGIAGGGAGQIKLIGFKDASHETPRVSPGSKNNPIVIY